MANQGSKEDWKPTRVTKRKATHARFVKKSYHWDSALQGFGASSGLTSTHMAVLMMSTTWADPDGSNIRPTQLAVAKALNLSLSSVSRAYRLGHELGWIFCTERANHRLNRAGVWRVCIPHWVPATTGEEAEGKLPSHPMWESRQGKRHQRPVAVDLPIPHQNEPLRELPPGVTDSNHRGEPLYGGNPNVNQSGGAGPHPAARQQHERMLRDEGYDEGGGDDGEGGRGPNYGRSRYQSR
jgi:hypothetical protein